MNLSQFNRILRQVFLLPVVALLLTAGALYWQIRGANATVNLIQDSDARIAQAALVAKLIADEESGLRGYETTLDTRFLCPSEARTELPVATSHRRTVLSAAPEARAWPSGLKATLLTQ